MAKDDQTADLFEADGVTPKVVEKPAPTAGEIKALERAARAEGEAAALKSVVTAKPAEKLQAEKVYSRQELRGLVNKGEITEDQMDETLENQLKASLTKTIEAKVESKVAVNQVTTKVSGDIARYVEAFPAINEQGSDVRARVEAEFQDLVKNGADASALSTELAAIKIACGPLKTGTGRRPAPDAHEETGGTGGEGNKTDSAGWAKGLTAPMKKHYEKLVNQGVYKGFSDPKLVTELNFARGKAH